MSIACELRLLRRGPLHGKAAEESSCQQHVIIIVVAIKYNRVVPVWVAQRTADCRSTEEGLEA